MKKIDKSYLNIQKELFCTELLLLIAEEKQIKEYKAPWLENAKTVLRDASGKFASKGSSVVEKTQKVSSEVGGLLKQELEIANLLLKNKEARKRMGMEVSMPMAKAIKSVVARNKSLDNLLGKKIDTYIADVEKEFAKTFGDDKSPIAQSFRKANLPPLDPNASLEDRLATYTSLLESYKDSLKDPKKYNQTEELLGKAFKVAIPVATTLAFAMAPEVAMSVLLSEAIDWGAIGASAVLGEAIDFGVQKGLEKAEVNNEYVKLAASVFSGLIGGGIAEGAFRSLKKGKIKVKSEPNSPLKPEAEIPISKESQKTLEKVEEKTKEKRSRLLESILNQEFPLPKIKESAVSENLDMGYLGKIKTVENEYNFSSANHEISFLRIANKIDENAGDIKNPLMKKFRKVFAKDIENTEHIMFTVDDDFDRLESLSRKDSMQVTRDLGNVFLNKIIQDVPDGKMLYCQAWKGDGIKNESMRKKAYKLFGFSDSLEVSWFKDTHQGAIKKGNELIPVKIDAKKIEQLTTEIPNLQETGLLINRFSKVSKTIKKNGDSISIEKLDELINSEIAPFLKINKEKNFGKNPLPSSSSLVNSFLNSPIVLLKTTGLSKLEKQALMGETKHLSGALLDLKKGGKIKTFEDATVNAINDIIDSLDQLKGAENSADLIKHLLGRIEALEKESPHRIISSEQMNEFLEFYT